MAGTCDCSVRGVLDAFKRLGGARPQTQTGGRVPVYVMLQLDWLTDDASALQNPEDLRRQVRLLRKAGVKGVMADVWWGLCEPEPQNYRFGGALKLCELLREEGLKLQSVMSFHQCGGNVGDAVSISLPKWALGPAKTAGLLYRSRHGVVSEDCLSLSADQERLFPGATGEKRTALECYRDYIAAFAKAMGSHVGSTIDEVQVGMGPCGELRYPSYMMSNGWEWPGVGLVMAHDAGMLRMLKQATSLLEPPEDLPDKQNAMPDDTPIFRVSKDVEQAGFRQGPGRVFLEWYSAILVAHGQDVLEAAAEGLQLSGVSAAPSDLAFSVKVSGLHWHVMHASRATEACAGYNNSTHDGADAYREIARMIARTSQAIGRPVFFNFTCLEMRNDPDTTVPQAMSAPEDLIAQVRRACVGCNVPLSGENALEVDPSRADNVPAFEQMRKQLRGISKGKDRMHGLTLLRLSDSFVSPSGVQRLAQFVAST